MAEKAVVADQSKGESQMDELEKQIAEAIACPCIGDLKEGPCGSVFVEALSCFIRSEEGDDKGMDCLVEFKSFQQCLAKTGDKKYTLPDPDEQDDQR